MATPMTPIASPYPEGPAHAGPRAQPVQRIVKVRRDYNRWVADETLEDYALRFAPRGFRKWSAFRVANTAFGAVSFLALEAIGATITLAYGFANAMAAIAVVCAVIFATGLPIAWRAARHGLDMDLLARGAGFGYLGSTLTSLIYASFTFIFFAIEAAIMAQAFELWFDMPRWLGYLLSALVVIPVVAHGVTAISRLQLWTQPLWLALLALPFVAVAVREPALLADFASLNGRSTDGDGFSWTAFGAAATVAASLIAQIGEQVDFLRFMPEPGREGRLRWWLAVICAGPGWIVLGGAKMVGGALLAFLALQSEVPLARALEPTQMYLAGFSLAVGPGTAAIVLTGVFVLVSQVKINVTNAYAGSLAWSNFFARLTHSHPGRVVWLLFNVLIAVLLMLMGVFEAIERVLGLYAHLAVAWVGAIVADLVIGKPLGLSPQGIEFRRAYLYDVNPSGFGAMALASVLSVSAYAGLLGEGAQAASAAIALGVALVATPLIAWATRGRYYVARTPARFGARHAIMRCAVCRNRFEADDMARCPAYGGAICSLCCTLDARCGDRCKPGTQAHEVAAALLARWLPAGLQPEMVRRIGQFALVLGGMVAIFGSMLWLLYVQQRMRPSGGDAIAGASVELLLLKVFAGLLLLAAVAAWWLVLAHESRRVAQEESERQNQLLQKEIDAHRQTDAQLQRAKEVAESANLAKSRFLTGMSHEMRSPLNSILGYSQVMLGGRDLSDVQREAVETIHRSGEHLGGLVDGLLELSRIERGKVRVEPEPLDLVEFFEQIRRMFAPLAQGKGLAFHHEIEGTLPRWVHADAKRLRQVVINLLSNAIKFTERGAVGLRIRWQREIAHIEVSDTGIGIARADHERVFRPFERVAHGAAGTGLGLTITQMLVELMGGDIHVRSEVGHGSRFVVRVYLPALHGEVPGVRAAAEDARIVGYEGVQRRLLVVDDERAHRRLLRRLLEPLGFAIDESDCGQDALRQASERRYDAVLLDIDLPDLTGWQVCARLRAQTARTPPAVLMVSGNAHENTESLLLQHGCQGFVAKPVAQTDLRAQLRAALGLAWTMQPLADPAAGQPVPAGEVLRELLALAAGGYRRAVVARLAEIAAESPSLRAWATRAGHVLEDDRDAFARWLGEALVDHERA
jgi:signal transduction histidine kinase/ActR/RegA family two-component response regulator